MIDVTLLKEESNQTIFLWNDKKWNECIFMWFHNGNIEVNIKGQLISIPKKNWNKLSFSGIDLKAINLN